MNEPINPDDTKVPEQPKSLELIQQVRVQLASMARKIPRESTDEVARKVNLLAVCFVNEKDDAIALQCLALIGIAAAKGSKEAAKRKPKVTRWLANAPPTLQIFQTEEERRSAVKLLASVKADWVSDFAFREAASPLYSKELVVDLIKWAYASVENGADLVTGLAGILRDRNTASAERVASMLKAVAKCLGLARVAGGAQLPDALLECAAALKGYCEAAKLPPKQVTAIQASGVAIADITSMQEPGVLFETQFQKALGVLSAIANGWGKSARKPLLSMCGRMLSIALLYARIDGISGSAEVSALLMFAANVLPLKAAAKKFSEQRSLINSLFQPATPDTGNSATVRPADLSVQEQVAALIIAWDAFRASLGDAAASEEVQLQIEAIAAKARLERIGRVGEVKTYQPLQHHLTAPRDPAADSVRIAVPGVCSIREDGTLRILIKALATPVT